MFQIAINEVSFFFLLFSNKMSFLEVTWVLVYDLKLPYISGDKDNFINTVYISNFKTNMLNCTIFQYDYLESSDHCK